jgi:mannose-6-phosphate isomerase-like protein (cupin superfamily)
MTIRVVMAVLATILQLAPSAPAAASQPPAAPSQPPPTSASQPPAAPSSATTSSVYISADEIARTLQQSIANNVVDQPIKAMDVTSPTAHRASLALLRRTQAETTALIHDRVTEIYQIVEGAGTIVTGGTLTDAKETDLARVNAGPSRTGVHQGGDSRRVGPKDVIIIPAGTAHRFSALDGPITYLVYRFEPKP